MSSTDPVSDTSLGTEASKASTTAPASENAAASNASTEPRPEPSAPEGAEANARADAAPAAESTGPADARDDSAAAEHGDEPAAPPAVDADPPAAGEAHAEQGKEGGPKKRRRRRKKKPHGGADASAEASHGDHPPRDGKQHHEHGRHGERPRRDRSRHRASDRAPFHVGEEVFGKVTAVLETAIMVDLSGKALAILDRSEMEADDLVPSPGDKFVARVHNDGARGGLVVLTRKPLREEETKAQLEQAHKDGTLVSGLITGAIKGGVEVDIGGVRAFAPASGMDLHPANANFTALVGQRMEFKVSQFDKAGRDVVVTRRPMLEAEAHERRKHALGLLQAGQVTPGVVRTVVEWVCSSRYQKRRTSRGSCTSRRRRTIRKPISSSTSSTAIAST
jgi:small subunit ribosomal protein S1